ncbi:MAG: hypothetical protein ACKV2O_05835 [Acidimicrobiales bacterium]
MRPYERDELYQEGLRIVETHRNFADRLKKLTPICEQLPKREARSLIAALLARSS